MATNNNELETYPYTFGIEEEFFLTHPKSRTLATSVPRSLLHACQRRFGNSVDGGSSSTSRRPRR